MQFTLSNGDHGASTNRNALANAAVAAPPEYHSYPNGHQFHSTKRSQTTPMLGNTRGSTLTTMTGGPRSQTLQGEERLGANAQVREPSYSPHYDPPTYPLYSQGVIAPASDVQHLTVPAPPSPSYKALGKRRAASIEPPVEYDLGAPNATVIHEGPGSPAPPYTAPRTSRPPPKGKHSKAVVRPPKAPAPRTRVMPSRQRRGTTYGIGSNPVDAMLIEAQQRAAEYVPIVDPDTVFVITTDPRGPPVAGPSTAGAQNTGKEDDRYFEREEVAENMRQQAIIQTPEFCLLSEVYQPSSRLRTRTEADVFDSSDAAYERRHRKHEMVEKRQRRREKDKLEHERYKLKERVEQLRAMDLQHFRALLPPSGGDSTQELESLRGELLAHADDLIRRYDILLPPDPRAANGQRLRLKEWEIRREGNRFIPLTDEAASELAAAGLLDEQSAAEAAAAGLLITTAGHGIPLGGKGGKGYGAGFRPDLPSSDEEEDEEGPEEDIDVAQNQEDTESNRQSSPDTDRAKSVQEDIQTGDDRQVLAVAVADELPRPSSGMLKIRLKVPRPSATPKSSDLSQDVTRSPSASAEVVPPQDEVVSITDAPSEVPRPPRAPSEAAPQNTIPQTTHLEPFAASHPTDDYPTPVPSITSLGGALTGANNGTWTELPYHDVPYEHQPRELPPATRTSVPPPAAPRVRTPAAATPAPVGMPVLLAVAEREANQAAGRRGRNLRTAEAFGVKLPRAFEEERDFRLPEEWLVQHMMTVDIDPSSAS